VDLVQITLPALRIEGSPDRVGDLPERVVAVDDVVGDRDDVMPRSPEEIHDLRNREGPVGVRRVNVEVAEQHVLRPAEASSERAKLPGGRREPGENSA
jgi:hypothetical protein